MTAPVSTDPGVTLTLPGPSITATVSWALVRRAFVDAGCKRIDCLDNDPAWEMWDHPKRVQRTDFVAWVLTEERTGEDAAVGAAITWLAKLASVSPGEMLQRIAVAT